MIHTRFLTVAILLCLAATVHAATVHAATVQAKEKELHFLKPDSIRVDYLLPAPPSLGSEEQKAEIEALLAIQATRTSEQVKRVEAEMKFDMTAFDGIMGSWFTPENLPKTNKLLKDAAAESKVFSTAAKDLFQRKRPYWDDDRLKPLGERETECGYPSGHATRGILFARILLKLEPKKKDRLLERGREIGWDRAIGGVHYPSDVAAGRELGLAVAHALLTNSEFKAQLREVKTEYERFKKEHTRVPPSPVAAK